MQSIIEAPRVKIPMTALQGLVLRDVHLVESILGKDQVPRELVIFVIQCRKGGSADAFYSGLIRGRWLHQRQGKVGGQDTPPSLTNLNGPDGDLLTRAEICHLCTHAKNGVRQFDKDIHLRPPGKPRPDGSLEELIDELTRSRGHKSHQYRWGDIVADHRHLEILQGGPLCARVSEAVFNRRIPGNKFPLCVRSKMVVDIKAFTKMGKPPCWRVSEPLVEALEEAGIHSTLTREQAAALVRRRHT